jgi:monoterpene epsilon-lactone hydrolase
VAPKNKNRVLLELHSADCWIDCGALGSQPIASIGKIKVVSVDYRDPEFPSAVEDVTSVYSGPLKTYKPGDTFCNAGFPVASNDSGFSR